MNIEFLRTGLFRAALGTAASCGFLLSGCGDGNPPSSELIDDPPPIPTNTPGPGNPDGKCAIPTEANLEDVSTPTSVVGDGTPQSCTSAAVVSAVAKGGIITFSCGPDPIQINLTETAKIFNDRGPKIVIDGGGKVTLSGNGKVRILYQNTCDQKQKWTTTHCQNQDHPQLTVQNLTFVDGNAKGQTPYGGGAIFASGGRFKAINTRFFRNVVDDTGPDVGGAAIRVLQQSEGRPAYVVNSTFGGETGLQNSGATRNSGRRCGVGNERRGRGEGCQCHGP